MRRPAILVTSCAVLLACGCQSALPTDTADLALPDGSPAGSTDGAVDAGAGDLLASGRDGGPGDLSGSDLAIPDGGGDLAVPMAAIGAPCPNGDECGPGEVCLGRKLGAGLPVDGYCTRLCQNDSDCGGSAFCGPALPGVGQLCWAPCGPNDSCDPNRVCSRRLNGLVDLVRKACIPGNASAVDGSPCTGFADCNKEQVCETNPYEAPGGVCATVGCTVGDDSTCAPGGDGTCIAIGTVNICRDTCTMQSECRTGENYVCAPTPLVQNVDLCTFPHAAPGAACASATDCGPSGSPWRCLAGQFFPNGYCSGAVGTCSPTDADSCPSNAHCFDPTPNRPASGDELCLANCSTDSDCRTGDGYSCKLDDPLAPNGPKSCRLQ